METITITTRSVSFGKNGDTVVQTIENEIPVDEAEDLLSLAARGSLDGVDKKTISDEIEVRTIDE